MGRLVVGWTGGPILKEISKSLRKLVLEDAHVLVNTLAERIKLSVVTSDFAVALAFESVKVQDRFRECSRRFRNNCELRGTGVFGAPW